MGEQNLKCLYIEDNIADFKLLEARLKKKEASQNYQITNCQTLQQAEKVLSTERYNLILLDISLPDAQGLEGLYFLQSKFPFIPIVVLTGNTDKKLALEAIKEGAQDYLIKGEFNEELFIKVCDYAVERKKINSELKKVLKEVEKLNLDLNTVNTRLQNTVEELKEERRRVERKNKQINSFISVIVHDLKNPVTAINTLTELLLENKTSLNINQIKYLDQIKYSSSSMLDNILTIINTTNISSNKEFELNMVYENPYFTLNSAIDKFVVDAIQKNIVVVVDYIKDLPKVYFDKRLLANIVANLMDNAIKYNKENTRVIITCEKSESNFLKIYFRNKGLKIIPEEVNDVFEEDYEFSEGNPATLPSSGFKLSVVKKVVEVMGGNVGVELEDRGKSTSIWFSLTM
ncbi:hybrid sensor histidine kinase/response regulator [Chondrinema litorale]|uniref:hybrid sensor histidine kinase/response regulator n=1 Tax=Chondrinema litorale TaxID=2994555 RepID=UPI002543B7E5|nr:hybrid sensor histidine kinase/response regulator [Chondrinema litorale]UZR92799.1 hybrid sensor histidine kinase/response regulator [Chondrinema litorale]